MCKAAAKLSGLLFLLWAMAPGCPITFAGELNTNAVAAWLSLTNYCSHVRFEVSRNRFLPDEHPDFSKEPDQMVQMEGAMLPHSYYVKYGTNAYGYELINGESDFAYWQVGNGLAIEYKDFALGGGPTNVMARGANREKSYLRGWLALGLMDIALSPIQLDGSKFSASRNGVELSGEFLSREEDGLPAAFKYELSGPEKYRVEGLIEWVDANSMRYSARLVIWLGTRHWKTVLIRVKDWTPATPADANRFFKPSEFLGRDVAVSKFILISNNVRHEMLPAGQLIPYEVDLPRKPGFLSLMGWFVTLAGILMAAWLLWLLSRIKTKKHKKQKT